MCIASVEVRTKVEQREAFPAGAEVCLAAIIPDDKEFCHRPMCYQEQTHVGALPSAGPNNHDRR